MKLITISNYLHYYLNIRGQCPAEFSSNQIQDICLKVSSEYEDLDLLVQVMFN